MLMVVEREIPLAAACSSLQSGDSGPWQRFCYPQFVLYKKLLARVRLCGRVHHMHSNKGKNKMEILSYMGMLARLFGEMLRSPSGKCLPETQSRHPLTPLPISLGAVDSTHK